MKKKSPDYWYYLSVCSMNNKRHWGGKGNVLHGIFTSCQTRIKSHAKCVSLCNKTIF